MNWLGRLNRGLDNDHTLCSAVKLITYADRGKMPPQADRLPSKTKQNKTKNPSLASTAWADGVDHQQGACETCRCCHLTRDLLYSTLDKSVYNHGTKTPLFTQCANIYCGWTWWAGGNLSKSQLVLILENEEWKRQDWSSTQFFQWPALIGMIHWTDRTPPPPVCFPFSRLVIPVLQNTSKRFHGMSMAGNPDKGFLCQKTNTKKNMVLM